MRDVVVIGGSVAGAATALHLARRGLDVLVVEQAAEPGRKACGEGIFPAGVGALEELGVADTATLPGQRLHGIRFHAGQHRAEARFGAGRQGLGVARPALDQAVRQAAQAAGVEFEFGVRAEGIVVGDGRISALRTSSGERAARAFVAADGLGSRFRRLAALEAGKPGNRYGVSAHVAAKSCEPYVQVFFEAGYELYLTPVAPGLTNVAVLTRREQMQAFRGDVHRAFEALLARAESEAVADAQPVDEPLAAGPFPRSCRRSWRGNLVLVGDAAGFFDGITGEGLSVALQGAKDAATAVESYLREGSYEPFRRYERQRRALVRRSDNLGRVTLLLSRSPVLAERSVRNLARRPATFERLLAVSSGDESALALRPRDLTGLLLGI